MNRRVLSLLMVALMISMGAIVTVAKADEIGSSISKSDITAGQWYVAPSGNDSNNCTDPTTPCATIMAAIDKASEGDIIYIAIGIYTSGGGYISIWIDKGLTLSGGWNTAFTSQEGYSTFDGRRLEMCMMNISATPVTVIRLILQNCVSGGDAGLINQGTLLLQDSVIKDSKPHGIINAYAYELTLVRTVVSNNSEAYEGGGILNYGKLTLINSAVLNNQGYFGAGIYNWDGEVILVNSTVRDNSAGHTGGGIDTSSAGVLKLYNSTITHNLASVQSGGIDVQNSGTVTMQNSLLADNLLGLDPGSPSDCHGTVNSAGYNLISNTMDCNFVPSTGDLLNIHPGGIRFNNTYALFSSSPAIDAGNPDGCLDDLGNPILDDQRGSPRPLDGDNDGSSICDIGAYEYDPDNPSRIYFLPCVGIACPVLYSDDFSNPNSGWPSGDYDETSFGYQSGEYRILIKTPEFFTVVYSGFHAQDYKFSVDLHNITGAFASYGIVFGLMPDLSGWYTLEIYPDGWFGIYRYDNYGGAVLAEAFSPAIKIGTATNLIKIERNADLITAYANGQQLASVSDSYFSGSLYLGMINFGYDYPDIDVRYDNFRVVPLSCKEKVLSTESSDISHGSWIDPNANEIEISFTKHTP